jgi:uncharacterized membrane-anchored protein
MTEAGRAALNKVPQVTLAFWIIKICATTLGETGGDQLSMTMKLGYLASTGILFGLFLVSLAGQVSAKRYHPWLYWAVILTTTMAGTTMSDFLDRTAHFGYIGGSLVLIAILVSILIAWRLTLGSISFDHVVDPKVESFYWVTILFSNTLGTALGDFVADDTGLGFMGGAVLFAGLIAVVALLYFFTKVPRAVLFWLAFVLTRPLGATLGDSLTKPHDHGGLALGTLPSSLVLCLVVIALVALAAQKPAPLVEDGHPS